MPLSKITNPFLDPAGSVNSNVYSPAANTLVMTSAGVEKLRATSTGIGIGGLTPGAALDVNTNIYITETSASSSNTQLTMFSKFSDGQRGYTILKTESNSSGSSDLVVRSRHSFSEAEKFRIDSVGRVTVPNQPAFMAHRTAGAVSGTGIYICNVVTFNDGSHYNSSTGRFTAPVAGRYQLNFFVLMQNGNNVDFHIRVGGVQYAGMDLRDNNATSGNFTLSCSAVLKLSANDIVDPYIAFQGAGSIYGSGLNGFSMHFLG